MLFVYDDRTPRVMAVRYVLLMAGALTKARQGNNSAAACSLAVGTPYV